MKPGVVPGDRAIFLYRGSIVLDGTVTEVRDDFWIVMKADIDGYETINPPSNVYGVST